VAQINPIGFTCGNYSKRAAVALPDPFHSLLPTWFGRILAFGQTKTGLVPKGCAAASIRKNARVDATCSVGNKSGSARRSSRD
jgi:hypothetical protein